MKKMKVKKIKVCNDKFAFDIQLVSFFLVLYRIFSFLIPIKSIVRRDKHNKMNFDMKSDIRLLILLFFNLTAVKT